VDPEFATLLFRVTLVGGAIGIISAGILFFAFRAFAPEVAGGREFRASLLIAVLLAFVLLCCAILVRLSLLR
jgi:hypothetical protein